MRASMLFPLLALVAFADDAPKERTFKDGKLVDPYWGVTYAAPALEQGMFAASGGGPRIFDGRCAGGVEVEILVQEADKEMQAAEWMALAKGQWAEKRKMQDVEEKETTILFMEESLAGFKRHHGYSFYARGPHAFIVHGTVQEKSDTSGEAIKAALQGLTLDATAAPALVAWVIAKQQAMAPEDPRLLFAAGQIYLSGNERMRQPKNLVMAERVLERAIREAKPETYGPDELWALHENMGLATLELRKLDVAIEWLVKSEQLAEKVTEGASGARNGQSSYNLACAYALASKIDEALAALDRCVAKGFLKEPENVNHMKVDTDLDNLHKDPRWEAYFKPAEAK
jgi:tetratricopeptide (TPR) repeat protein